MFGGGIGERSAAVRRRICTGLTWAGLELSEPANDEGEEIERRISVDDSRIEAWVIPVDEASVIARDVVSVLTPEVREAP